MVAEDCMILEKECSTLGLTLNRSKCEIITKAVNCSTKTLSKTCLYRSRRCNTPGSTAVHRGCLGTSTKFKSGGTRQSFGKTGHNSTPRCPANTQTLTRHS